MGAMIRTASLRGFVPLIEELGGDPAPLLERFGISAQTLADPDGLVDITSHDLMLDAAAEEFACPDLSLRLAQSQDVTVLGPLAVAIQACSTVAEALQVASRFLFVHSPALSVAVETDPYEQQGVVALTYRKDLHESPYSPQATELGLAVFFRVARALIGGLDSLRTVEVPHHPLSPVERYTEFFGADVKFDRPTAALRVERRILDESFATANDTIRQLALDHLAETYADPGHLVTTQVRRVLAESLGSTKPGIASVAALLAMHPRTLQRHLAAEGATFEAILDGVRRDAAHRYLSMTDLPLGQVSALVGFTEQSTLSHAVRRWFGVAPRSVRRAGAGVPSTNLSH